MKQVLAGLFFLALFGFFSWWLGPGILADYGLKGQQLEPAAGLRVTEARCRSKLFVISFCDIKFERANGSKEELNYLIASNFSGETVELLAPKGQQSPITTNIGQEYLTNRVVSFAVMELLMGALMFGGIIGYLKSQRAEG